MSENPRHGFDSSASIAYIHQDKGGRQPPGGDELEQRVRKLEGEMSDIKVMLGRIDERLTGMANNLATKADLEALRGELKEVRGALTGKLGFWQFITALGGAVTLILAWPALSGMLGTG